MPNRMIKDSIFESEKLSGLTDLEFRVWISLILLADDNGCGDARPAIIKGRAFPLCDSIRADDIDRCIAALMESKCITVYCVGGKPYYQFPSWKNHQRLRNTSGKYPLPPAADRSNKNNSAATCRKLPQVAANRCLEVEVEEELELEVEVEEELRARRSPKPAAAVADGIDLGTVEVYLANNITGLSATLMQEFQTFKADLPEELIRYAIDEACAQNVRSYSYLRKILNRYVDKGFKTIGDVKADRDAFERGKKAKAAPAKHNYQQHEYTEGDFGADFYYDPSKDYGGGV